jgi:hypothetical protein
MQTTKGDLLWIFFAIVILDENNLASERLGSLMHHFLPIPQAMHLEHEQIFARLPADWIMRKIPNRLHLTK